MTGAIKQGTIPPPHHGLVGEWDKLVGPGAARWENAGTLGFAAAGAIAAPALVKRQRPDAGVLDGFKLLLGHGTPRGPLSALRRRRRSPSG